MKKKKTVVYTENCNSVPSRFCVHPAGEPRIFSVFLFLFSPFRKLCTSRTCAHSIYKNVFIHIHVASTIGNSLENEQLHDTMNRYTSV